MKLYQKVGKVSLHKINNKNNFNLLLYNLQLHSTSRFPRSLFPPSSLPKGWKSFMFANYLAESLSNNWKSSLIRNLHIFRIEYIAKEYKNSEDDKMISINMYKYIYIK